VSRIYFHSIEGDEIGVRGSERAYFGGLISEIALAVLQPSSHNMERYKKVFPANSYVALSDEREFERNFRLWLRVGSDREGFSMNGKNIDTFEVALNTAYVVGSDPIKLATRIHGQCELHCFMEGPNRAWMAEIIKVGLKSKIYRANQGWEEVISLLEMTGDSPVVLSFSGGDSFPDQSSADYHNDDWYDLPDSQRWEMGMAGIRKERGLEIKPDNWNEFFFSHGITAFDVVEYINREGTNA
jgi:hypothetical protein